MPRRGRCRCGTILEFRRTSQGYKTRCPACKAIVRLRSRDKSAPRAVRASHSSSTLIVAGSAPVLESPPPPSLPILPSLPPLPIDLSVLDERDDLDSHGPMAQLELEAYHDPAPIPPSGNTLALWLIGLVLVLVLGSIAALALLLHSARPSP